MSDQVRPTDVYAVARLDWCRPSRASEGGPAAQLVCSNLARQCGSFTNATRDRERVARTAPQLQLLLREPEIESWSGKCPKVEVSGVCGLGGIKGFQEQLWRDLAAPREQAAYDVAAGRGPPPGGDLLPAGPVELSRAAAPSLLGSPFL
jgi:hypothetical protein